MRVAGLRSARLRYQPQEQIRQVQIYSYLFSGAILVGNFILVNLDWSAYILSVFGAHVVLIYIMERVVTGETA